MVRHSKEPAKRGDSLGYVDSLVWSTACEETAGSKKRVFRRRVFLRAVSRGSSPSNVYQTLF